MKRSAIELCLVLLGIAGIHAVSFVRSGFIQGRILTGKSKNFLVAVCGADSIKTTSEPDGNFDLRLKPGTWKLIVDYDEHSTSVVREKLQVSEGEKINLGIIRVLE